MNLSGVDVHLACVADDACGGAAGRVVLTSADARSVTVGQIVVPAADAGIGTAGGIGSLGCVSAPRPSTELMSKPCGDPAAGGAARDRRTAANSAKAHAEINTEQRTPIEDLSAGVVELEELFDKRPAKTGSPEKPLLHGCERSTSRAVASGPTTRMIAIRGAYYRSAARHAPPPQERVKSRSGCRDHLPIHLLNIARTCRAVRPDGVFATPPASARHRR